MSESSRTVVITRPEEHRAALVALVTERGWSPFPMALIRYERLELDPGGRAVTAAVSRGDAEWVVFTSAAGPRYSDELSIPSSVRIAAQGQGTAAAVSARFGRVPDFVARGVTAEHFASELASVLAPGTTVVLPGAEESRGVLLGDLEQAGMRTVSLPVYRTIPTRPSENELANLVSRPPRSTVFTFFSPSAVRSALGCGDALKSFLLQASIVTVGSITSDAVRAASLVVRAEARTASDAAVIECLDALP